MHTTGTQHDSGTGKQACIVAEGKVHGFLGHNLGSVMDSWLHLVQAEL